MEPTSARRVAHSAIIGLIAVTFCSACGFSVQFDSGGDVGPSVEETIDIEEFTELEIDSAFDAELIVGDSPSLTIEISESLLDDLEVTQEGQHLKLNVDAGNVTGSHVLNATISTPSVEEISVDGAVRLNIGELEVDQLRLEVDGASQVEGSGRVNELTVVADGAARVNFDQMLIVLAEVKAGGASNISIEQAEQVEGELDGAARLGVGDDTLVRVDTAGASAVD